MYYFAYGSNMVSSQMAIRCPNASVVGVGCLHGYAFQINSRGVATVIPDITKQVYGLLWDIPPQEMLTLDRYEGVKVGLYQRTTVTVELSSEHQVEVLTYIATDHAIGSPRPYYMESIVAAAKQYRLPPAYIQELTTWLLTDG
jgi:gamma-glutamylcyclotransferase (GGCT)/AIG2-like uncharacterized protein YtfP